MFRRIHLAVLLIGISTFARPANPVERNVSGTVTALDGSLAVGASVEAVPVANEKSGGSTGQRTWVQTDSAGYFHLTLPPGRYEIRAKWETEGYPDPNFLLSADSTAKFPEILVNSADISDVQVILGAKGGVLQGDLRNKLNLGPVQSGKVIIRDARRPQAFVEVSTDKTGHFAFAVPSKPLLISAVAPGYKASKLDREVTLSGGEHRTIILDLEPQ